MDLPNGGVAVLVGNLVQQSRRTENSALISFGAEGYRPSDKPGLPDRQHPGQRAAAGWRLPARGRRRPAAVALNNLLVGPGRLQGGGALEQANNPRLSPQDFVDPEHHDYRLREDPAHARLQWLAPALAEVGGVSLVPSAQRVAPRSLRRLDRPPRWPSTSGRGRALMNAAPIAPQQPHHQQHRQQQRRAEQRRRAPARPPPRRAPAARPASARPRPAAGTAATPRAG